VKARRVFVTDRNKNVFVASVNVLEQVGVELSLLEVTLRPVLERSMDLCDT
jgi:hypothetical protein